MTSSERIKWLDIAKGLTIICTIIGHTVLFGSQIRNLIFSFHMPLFFLIAGYTIKKIAMNQLWVATVKDFKRLIVPCIGLRILNAGFDFFVNHRTFKEVFFDNLMRFLWGNGNEYVYGDFEFLGIGVIWFLIALFWGKLFYRIMMQMVPSYRMMFLLFGTFGSILVGQRIRLPQGVDLIFLIMFFMECGKQYRDKLEHRGGALEEILGMLFFPLWIYLSWDKGIYIEIATRQYPLTMVCVFIALISCLCVIQFCKALADIGYINEFLSWVGMGSLELLCIHHLDYWGYKLWSHPSTIVMSVRRVAFDIIILLIWYGLKKILKQIKENM